MDFHVHQFNRVRHDQNFPPGPDERRVPQYSPEWMAHVLGGGAVRNGNILVSEETFTNVV